MNRSPARRLRPRALALPLAVPAPEGRWLALAAAALAAAGMAAGGPAWGLCGLWRG